MSNSDSVFEMVLKMTDLILVLHACILADKNDRLISPCIKQCRALFSLGLKARRQTGIQLR